MKILAITDLDGKTELLENFRAAVEEEAPGMIVFTGNIVKGDARAAEWHAAQRENRPPRRDLPVMCDEEREGLRAYDAFFSALAEIKARAYVIPGGNDAPLDVFLQVATNREVVAHNTHIVHNRITSKFVSPQARDMYVCGFGGIVNEKETEDFFVLQFSRWRALYAAQGFIEYPDPKVLLLHTPPRLMSDNGSAVVEEIISTVRPSHAFCGAPGGLQGAKNVGTTFVVCPGAMADGNYAVVDSLTNKVEYKKLGVGAAHTV